MTGQTIAQYQILAKLGAGGMGVGRLSVVSFAAVLGLDLTSVQPSGRG